MKLNTKPFVMPSWPNWQTKTTKLAADWRQLQQDLQTIRHAQRQLTVSLQQLQRTLPAVQAAGQALQTHIRQLLAQDKA